ncbi:TetR/AcrR family transcriptional regulator [Sphingobium yanoikuyae]|uniref:TetR/AcrR family transcriptional regulator n=1 Tax=Sphingobium yanoikuyae TaxID=13690 RepID=UPI0022DE70A6|nr:TetR/AcrR family transcriptional regulator [Sphingobium yanoikuyae]WBQ14893.1 TetR/AcrR family transcriptional regulator [Sphingobium yanoikuyae]
MTCPEKALAPSRREARRLDRRQTILEVAARHFLENGYAATSMSAIAAILGGSKGTLWNHFPSKEELFRAVLENATSTYRARLSEILDPGGDLASTLHRTALSLLEKVTSPEAIALHRLIASEGGRFPEMSRIFYEMAPSHTRMLLARFLEGAMDRGQLRRDDPDKAARVLMRLTTSGCHELLLLSQIERVTPQQMESDAAFAVDIFMRAYGAEGMAR